MTGGGGFRKSELTRRRLKAFTRDELVEVRIMLNGGRVQLKHEMAK